MRHPTTSLLSVVTGSFVVLVTLTCRRLVAAWSGQLRRGHQDAPRDIQVPLAPRSSTFHGSSNEGVARRRSWSRCSLRESTLVRERNMAQRNGMPSGKASMRVFVMKQVRE
jgi:hypothetical protein